jgi:hypothetical protein
MAHLMIKFGSEKNIKSMFDEEYLFFSAQRSFRKQLDEIGRMDPAEGNLAIHNITSGKLMLPTGDITLDIISGQVFEFLAEDHKLLCSLYRPELDQDYQIIDFDERMLAFGPCAMVIHDIPGFFALLFGSFRQLGLEYSSREATYFDSQLLNGEISVHHKDLRYAYQREHRIMTWIPDVEFFKLPLPGMQAFVSIVDSCDVPHLKISVTNRIAN